MSNPSTLGQASGAAVGMRAARSAGAGTKPVNAVEFFEHHAHEVWESRESPDEKAKKLYAISDSINKYVRRIDAGFVSAGSPGLWIQFSARRSKLYLMELGQDVRNLAVACQREAVAGGVRP